MIIPGGLVGPVTRGYGDWRTAWRIPPSSTLLDGPSNSNPTLVVDAASRLDISGVLVIANDAVAPQISQVPAVGPLLETSVEEASLTKTGVYLSRSPCFPGPPINETKVANE